MKTLVTGGTRSGKSAYAERLMWQLPEVTYLATAHTYPDDPEWVERVRLHQRRRPGGWQTVETLDVASVLSSPGPPVLLDCVGMWLTRSMDETGCWENEPDARALLAQRIDELVAAWEGSPRDLVGVTNEVGWGVVPATRSGRLFADELGRVNARLAAAADRVVLCVAGIPMTIAGEEVAVRSAEGSGAAAAEARRMR